MNLYGLVGLVCACLLLGFAIHVNCESTTLAIVSGFCGAIVGGIFGNAQPSDTKTIFADRRRQSPPTEPVLPVRVDKEG